MCEWFQTRNFPAPHLNTQSWTHVQKIFPQIYFGGNLTRDIRMKLLIVNRHRGRHYAGLLKKTDKLIGPYK